MGHGHHHGKDPKAGAGHVHGEAGHDHDHDHDGHVHDDHGHDHDAHAGHSHAGHSHGLGAHRSSGPSREGEARRLVLTLLISVAAVIAEGVGGYLSHSLALLSDAAHLLADVGAIALSVFAVVVASRPADQRRTFGWYRLEILAALVNGAALIAIAVFIVIEAVQRLRDPQPVAVGIVVPLALGAQILPPSPVRRIVPPFPTDQPCKPSAANCTENRGFQVPLNFSDQLLPPSLVAKMVPSSPTAQPCWPLPENRTERRPFEVPPA